MRQRSLSCVTEQIVRADGYDVAGGPHSLLLARGVAVRLAGAIPAALRIAERYRLAESTSARGSWQVIVSNHMYTLEVPGTEAEFLAFHWHPDAPGVSFPHVHLGPGLAMRADLIGVHVPTGHVALEDVLRFAISELGVQPRRPNWASLLEHTRAASEAP